MQAKHRKNFFPTFILAILFWIFWAFVVIKIPPNSAFSIIIFYFSFFLAAFLTTALVLASSKLGFLTACFLNLVLVFRYFQIGNPLNLLLLFGVYIALALYFRK